MTATVVACAVAAAAGLLFGVLAERCAEWMTGGGAPPQQRRLRMLLLGPLCAASFVGFYLSYGVCLTAVVYALAAAALFTASAVDFARRIIPDRIVLFLLCLGALLLFFGDGQPWWSRVIGFFAVSLPMLLVAAFLGGLGAGDVKLMAACGLILGWKLIIFALFFGSVFASVAGIYLMLCKKATRRTEIAFGPYLSLGVICTMLWGSSLLAALLR